MNMASVLLSRLQKVRGKEPKWMACCPAHDDRNPSLSIKAEDDGRVLVHCFAGCDAADVVAAVGLSLGDLSPKGALGEFSSKPFRSPENKVYKGGFLNMQDQIWKLRARLSAK